MEIADLYIISSCVVVYYHTLSKIYGISILVLYILEGLIKWYSYSVYCVMKLVYKRSTLRNNGSDCLPVCFSSVLFI